MSKESEDREVLDQIYAAFFAGDLDQWINFWTEDSELWEADSLPYGGTAKGLVQIRETAEQMGEAWEDLDLEIHDIVGNDDRLITYGTWTGTGRKTGKSATFPFAEVWVFKDHKVLKVTPIYGDTALINSVLG